MEFKSTKYSWASGSFGNKVGTSLLMDPRALIYVSFPLCLPDSSPFLVSGYFSMHMSQTWPM